MNKHIYQYKPKRTAIETADAFLHKVLFGLALLLIVALVYGEFIA